VQSLNATCHAGEVTDEIRESDTRRARLWRFAESRHVPLRAILAAVAAVVLAYLAGKLVDRLRGVLLLFAVAGFVALLLNPLVVTLQRFLRRRGFAVAVVALVSVAAFAGLAVAFGYPLINGLSHLASYLPNYVTTAEHGKGWVGRLVMRYHLQQWVTKNSPKLVVYGKDLAQPALSLGEGAASIAFELFTIFVLVVLLLLEGPRLRRGLLGLMRPSRASRFILVAGEVNRSVTGFMLGNFATSVIAGVVVLVTLLALGVQFPFLWALWVALVDFLPMIGGALAGIPVVLFAAAHSVWPAGIVTLIVFLVYTQIENHVLNPVIMSRTVKISPLLVLVAILVGASIGNWIGGLFGGFVAALLAIPVAGAMQVIVREIWWATAPPEARSAGPQSDETAQAPAVGTLPDAAAVEPEVAAGPAAASTAGSATLTP
jgi:predicted PurR-regulated permease PerM